MCGVIGLVCEQSRDDLGAIAATLLKTLEYRGYDSTGAAIQGSELSVDLRKDVGAPSVLVESLGITGLAGQVFCGQVRWATFGAVDKENAQPHVVRCHTFLYGAHNGNVTNSDVMKDWLVSEGHDVLSDNDGEMVVHAVEHFFARELKDIDETDHEARGGALRRAVRSASEKLRGSFAAVVVDPVTRRAIAIKRGSSLYFGVGRDDTGAFGVASSDLSSVLKMTRGVVALSEGEAIHYDAERFEVFSLVDGSVIERVPTRSRLRVGDTALAPEFRTFMEQEIYAQPSTCRAAVRMFAGGGEGAHLVADRVDTFSDEEHEAIEREVERLRNSLSEDVTAEAVTALRASPVANLDVNTGLISSDAPILGELSDPGLARALDAYLDLRESRELGRSVDALCDAIELARKQHGRVLLISCGTSYHASKAAALFFAELAGVEVVPLLPGEFRGQYLATLRDGDLLIAISQSGETKDLVDAINAARATGHAVRCAALVNNLNSTIAQEKAEVVVPLRCGPEIAVPATKSFINQLTVFYGLAERLGARAGRVAPKTSMTDLPALLERALEVDIEKAADLLYQAPSMHLLAIRLLAVAKEGALKIREVVLNHTEGFEGSEFKHGPNTILGFNTIFGLAQVQALLDQLAEQNADAHTIKNALRADVLGTESLYADYPLVFITGPEDRDVELTVSQINTHKIRGAITIVIAEDDPRLRRAAERAPAGSENYNAVYLALPRTGDTCATAFTATIALQKLALAMSEKKMSLLDSLGVPEHGVHPDVPKNVSKSITVD